MAFLTQVITNQSSTDALVLDAKLGGDTIAASGNRTKTIDSDNVDAEYIAALQGHVNKQEATVTHAPTAAVEGDVLADFNQAVQKDVAIERTGTSAFSAALTVAVVLTTPMPDDQYMVLAEADAAVGLGVNPFITTKTDAGFTIEFEAAFTGNVNWLVKPL